MVMLLLELALLYGDVVAELALLYGDVVAEGGITIW